MNGHESGERPVVTPSNGGRRPTPTSVPEIRTERSQDTPRRVGGVGKKPVPRTGWSSLTPGSQTLTRGTRDRYLSTVGQVWTSGMSWNPGVRRDPTYKSAFSSVGVSPS